MAGKEQQDLQLQHMKLQEEYIFPVNTVSNSELKRVKVVIHVPIRSLPHIALINLASFSDRSQVAGSIMSIRCYSHCVNINQVVKCCHEQWSIASAVVLC